MAKKYERVFIDMEECRRRVTVDFERDMGITDALQNDSDEETLELVARARKVLEPTIEECTQFLFRWLNK